MYPTIPHMVLFFLCSGYVYSPKGTIWQDIGRKAKQFLWTIAKFALLVTAIYFVRYILIDHRSLLWFADNTVTNVLALTSWNLRLGAAPSNLMRYGFVPFWFVEEMFTAFCLFIPVQRFHFRTRSPVGILLSKNVPRPRRRPDVALFSVVEHFLIL